MPLSARALTIFNEAKAELKWPTQISGEFQKWVGVKGEAGVKCRPRSVLLTGLYRQGNSASCLFDHAFHTHMSYLKPQTSRRAEEEKEKKEALPLLTTAAVLSHLSLTMGGGRRAGASPHRPPPSTAAVPHPAKLPGLTFHMPTSTASQFGYLFPTAGDNGRAQPQDQTEKFQDP